MSRQQTTIARMTRTAAALLTTAAVLSVAACKKGDADAAPA